MSCNILLGGAIGDALGMTFEQKLSNYQPLIDWDGKTFLPSEHHKLNAGQWTDDTQMSLMVVESLLDHKGFNPDDLATRYMDWIFSGRARGYGGTCFKAIHQLKDGYHWSGSGILGSFGNGTAMRAAPFGIYFRDDFKFLIESVKVDSAITHASEEAEAGALAIALTAAYAVNDDTNDLLNKLQPYLPDSKVKEILFSLSSLIDSPNITAEQALGVLGTKGDVRQTVPAVIYLFLKMNNHHEAIVAAIKAGGDTDTTAAIVGALFGAKNGMKGMNPYLVSTVEDSEKLMELDRKLFNRNEY